MNRLKQALDSRGITQKSCAKLLGITEKTLSFLGKRRLPADEMVSICREVGIDLSDLASDRPGA